jgi:F-type H+-transporting ATPase subunit gamma
MAKGIKELRRRIRSIKSTKKITRAREMVSASKLRRSQTVMEGAKPFTLKLEQLLGRLARSSSAQQNPLFDKRPAGSAPPLLLLFTSDRGLCGAFNANLIKLAEKYMQAHPDAFMYIVGRKGRDYFRRRYPDQIVESIVDTGGRVDGKMTDRIGSEIVGMFLEKKVSEINIVASEFLSTATNRPRLSRYLPLEAEAFGVADEQEGAKAIDYLLEPSPDRVFEALLPRYLRNKIYLSMAETVTSEHASRMLAMNNATKNCNELETKFTLQMNKARQAAITTEIIEIVSGAEALAG